MMNKTFKYLCFAMVLAVAVACHPGKNDTGVIFMPDMHYSQAYETYGTSNIMEPENDTMMARLPVAGTIPRGLIPQDKSIKNNESYLYAYTAKQHFTNVPEAVAAEYELASTTLKNPLTATTEVLTEGGRLYNIYCSVCHGAKGEGAGQIVVLPNGDDGPYGAIPPAYSTKLAQVTDGGVFHTLTFGKGNMGSYASQLTVDERWKVIHYIRATFAPETVAAAE